jgi:hypothetical protein
VGALIAIPLTMGAVAVAGVGNKVEAVADNKVEAEAERGMAAAELGIGSKAEAEAEAGRAVGEIDATRSSGAADATSCGELSTRRH